MGVFLKISKGDKVYAAIELGYGGDVSLDIINVLKREFDVIQVESVEYYKLKTQIEFDYWKSINKI